MKSAHEIDNFILKEMIDNYTRFLQMAKNPAVDKFYMMAALHRKSCDYDLCNHLAWAFCNHMMGWYNYYNNKLYSIFIKRFGVGRVGIGKKHDNLCPMPVDCDFSEFANIFQYRLNELLSIQKELNEIDPCQ